MEVHLDRDVSMVNHDNIHNVSRGVRDPLLDELNDHCSAVNCIAPLHLQWQPFWLPASLIVSSRDPILTLTLSPLLDHTKISLNASSGISVSFSP